MSARCQPVRAAELMSRHVRVADSDLETIYVDDLVDNAIEWTGHGDTSMASSSSSQTQTSRWQAS
jgi:hypothetical protein